MKHAGPQTLASLAPLLRRLRAMPALVERRPGVFYLGSRAYLHFHDDRAGIFADVKLDLATFTRVPVSTATDRASLVTRVLRSLAARRPAEAGRHAARCAVSRASRMAGRRTLRGMAGSIRLALLLCIAWLGAPQAARAQDLSPRAYVITPIGSNALVAGYSHLEGGLQLNGAVPITGAQADVNLAVLSYYHAFGFLGRSANFTVVVPYGWGDFMGTVANVPRNAQRSGSLDSYGRFSVNLIGGPAMQPAEFADWRQNVLLGASFEIVAPTGQYDPTRLVNWGSNRWAFKPEIGYSERWGHWLLDAYAAVWFFTDNPAYYPGAEMQTEAPVGAVETHLSYDFKPRLWVSLDANFWWGGATSLDSVRDAATEEKNSRVGVTASIPLTVHQSIKISFSDGAYIRYGGNYRNVSLAWQYGWIGLPKFH